MGEPLLVDLEQSEIREYYDSILLRILRSVTVKVYWYKTRDLALEWVGSNCPIGSTRLLVSGLTDLVYILKTGSR